ncbi:MAG TPA: hypothetical protein VGK74_17795 [Symbiobacteriaceae bacterium]|jgi:hypothetical protein
MRRILVIGSVTLALLVGAAALPTTAPLAPPTALACAFDGGPCPSAPTPGPTL